MDLRIIGAGLPRTGTSSAKRAIETLTGGRCYHMREVFAEGNEEHPALWVRALNGELSVFEQIFDGYIATIDWPASAFWRELAGMASEAPVLLTHRGDAETWWRSADRTVWAFMRQQRDAGIASELNEGLRARFHPDLDDAAGSKMAYERHHLEVLAEVEPARLVAMTPSDGWEPLCRALDVPVPEDAFPRLNSSEQFRAHNGWD